MGFNIGGAVNATAAWVCDAPVIKGVIRNPIFTALLITALAAVVVMAMYHYPVKSGGKKRAARTAIYVFFLVTAVMFVHHYVVARAARETASAQGVREVFSSIQETRHGGVPDAVPVYPMGFDTRALGVMGGRDSAGGAAGCDTCPARPDNVAVAEGLNIEDVVMPVTTGPFSGGASRR